MAKPERYITRLHDLDRVGTGKDADNYSRSTEDTTFVIYLPGPVNVEKIETIRVASIHLHKCSVHDSRHNKLVLSSRDHRDEWIHDVDRLIYNFDRFPNGTIRCRDNECLDISVSNGKSNPELVIKSVVQMWTDAGPKTYYNFGYGYVLSTATQIATLDRVLFDNAATKLAEVKLRHISMVTEL